MNEPTRINEIESLDDPGDNPENSQVDIIHVLRSAQAHHVSLSSNADQKANIVLGSYLVLVAGNALVILLEGLSAGIQSLRLNYYEFFSKYFSGSGRAYAPVTLRKKMQ